MNRAKVKKSSNPSLSSIYFICGLAVFFTFVLNSPFIIKAFISIKETNTFFSSLLFALGLTCHLICLFISLFSLLCIKYFEKTLIIGLILISSVLSYVYAYYGYISDNQFSFMETIAKSNLKEILPYITPSFLSWFVIIGMLPTIYIYKIQLVHPPLWKNSLIKLGGICLYPLFYALTSLPSWTTYHPLLVETGLVARTPFQMIPTNFSEELYNHYKHHITPYIPYQSIGLDATNMNKTKDGKKNLLVLVVGETARSMNFELNGYARKTNPYTIKQNVISFKKVASCGTSTRVALPCLFSSSPRRTFYPFLADHQDNLLHILKRADLNLIWIDNNGAGNCQGICKSIESIVLNDLDGVVIKELRQKLKAIVNKDSFIVLHLHGSHGPDYFEKYPDSFRYFTPDCRKNDFRFCNKQALINAYDNTILYTDFVLSQVIETLQEHHTLFNSALIYTSDHGESLGEKGIYEHCTPYVIAPIEQTQVPLIVWMSDEFMKQKSLSKLCLQKKALHGAYSHDFIFHSILGLMDIQTTVYQPPLDIFESCRKTRSY